MLLKRLGAIAIPNGLNSDFDHAAFDPKTRRVFTGASSHSPMSDECRSSAAGRARIQSSAWARLALPSMLALLMGGNAMAETLNFDSAAVGTSPDGWTLTMTGKGQPKWTVEAEATARSKPNVLKQSGRATFPLAIKRDTSIRDGFVEVKFKAVAGSEDRAAGVIWRAKDADNYYVVRANALEDNVVLYKTINGVRMSLEIVGRRGGYGVSAPVSSGQWHLLRCDFAGSRFKVSYDGKQLFEVEDATIPDAGMIGLWTKADSVTLFDDLTYGESK